MMLGMGMQVACCPTFMQSSYPRRLGRQRVLQALSAKSSELKMDAALHV